jgi:hypothetical protein
MDQSKEMRRVQNDNKQEAHQHDEQSLANPNLVDKSNTQVHM